MMVECRIVFKNRQPVQVSLVRSFLAGLGVTEREIVEQEETGAVSLCFYCRFRRRAAFLKKKLSGLAAKDLLVTFRLLHNADWKTRWKKYFKPFDIVPGLRIVPVWEKKIKEKSDRAIYIDTTSAFGTGLHATTQLMAEFIAEHRHELGKFLDIGTGTGILSLIADRCGASEIRALDIDSRAIKTASRNFAMNNCLPKMLKKESFERFATTRRFDFVAANLLTADLLRFQKKLTSLVYPGGYLAVSGIYRDNYRLFRKRFLLKQLRMVKVRKRKGWYAALWRKKSDDNA